MAAKMPSTKRVQIDKANATMIIAIAVSSFLLVFCLIAGKSLLAQRSYQARIIAKKEKARDQLKQNIDNANKLSTSYQAFMGTSSNIIGGDPNGTGARDGDNTKIVLDALPSSYDFPALANSLYSLLNQSGVKVGNVSGSDDQIAQQNTTASATPNYITIPFQATVTGNYNSIQSLITSLERSIRPIQIQTLSFSGNDQDLSVNIAAQTYYQPAVSIKLGSETVK